MVRALHHALYLHASTVPVLLITLVQGGSMHICCSGAVPAGGDERAAAAGVGQHARHGHPPDHRVQLVLWRDAGPDAQPVCAPVHR